MVIPEYSILCALSYALGRRRTVFRRWLGGGPKAEACLEELAVAVMRHLSLCGWRVVGVNSDEAASAAIIRGLGLADAVNMADMAQAHHRIEDSGMKVAGAVLGAIRAAGGNIERTKPLAPLHTSPPRGLAPGTIETPPAGWYD